MAAARDQAARILRVEPDTAEAEPAHDHAALAAQFRAHLAKDTVARPPAEAPDKTVKPAVAPAATATPAAPKPGKRRLILVGLGALLALAAAGYGTEYLLVGRFFVSTDDAY